MSKTPYLSLNISRSPLLADDTLQTCTASNIVPKETTTTRDLISALLTKPAFDNARTHKSTGNLATQSSSDLPSHSELSTSRSLLSVPCLPSQLLSTETEKPLPLTPPAFPITRHAIMSFLDLLDSLNADVASEVARVTRHIQETHSLIDVYKTERTEAQMRVLSRRERRPQDTNLMDLTNHDF